MRILCRLFSLTLPQTVALIRAAMYVVLVRAALWALPFRWIEKYIRGKSAGVKKCGDPNEIRWAVRNVSRGIPAATCLTQALAEYLLLLRAGHACSLHVAVAKEGAGLRAHAWTQTGGRPAARFEAGTDYALLPPLFVPDSNHPNS